MEQKISSTLNTSNCVHSSALERMRGGEPPPNDIVGRRKVTDPSKPPASLIKHSAAHVRLDSGAFHGFLDVVSLALLGVRQHAIGFIE